MLGSSVGFSFSIEYAKPSVIVKEKARKKIKQHKKAKHLKKIKKKLEDSKTLYSVSSIILSIGAATVFIIAAVFALPWYIWLIGIALLLLALTFLLLALKK